LPPPSEQFRVESDRDGTWAVIKVFGELDLDTVRIFDAEVDRHFGEGERPTGLLVDISGLTFTDSSGVRAAVLASQRVNGRFGLIGVPERIQRLLAMTGLGVAMESFPDVETAKAALV
jgi:anti-sigma B factor antagonist